MNPMTTVTGVISMEKHQKWRHYEEQNVGGGVDKLRNVGREGVVLLAPVDWT